MARARATRVNEQVVTTNAAFKLKWGRDKAAYEYPRTLGEVKEVLAEMHAMTEGLYWQLFREGFATKCHPFLEFIGVMNGYLELCACMVNKGLDYSLCKRELMHTYPLEMNEDQAQYISQKLDCIFGPALRNNPKAAAIFRRNLGL